MKTTMMAYDPIHPIRQGIDLQLNCVEFSFVPPNSSKPYESSYRQFLKFPRDVPGVSEEPKITESSLVLYSDVRV